MNDEPGGMDLVVDALLSIATELQNIAGALAEYAEGEGLDGNTDLLFSPEGPSDGSGA